MLPDSRGWKRDALARTSPPAAAPLSPPPAESRKKVRGGLQAALAAAAPPAAAPIAPHRSPTPPPPKPPPTDAQPHRATPPYRPLHPPRRRQPSGPPSGPPYLRTPAPGRKLMCRQHRLPGNRCAGRPRADIAAGVLSPLRNARQGLRACSQCPLALPLSGTPRGLTPYSLVRTYSHSRASPEAHIPCAANNSQTCLHPPPGNKRNCLPCCNPNLQSSNAQTYLNSLNRHYSPAPQRAARTSSASRTQPRQIRQSSLTWPPARRPTVVT